MVRITYRQAFGNPRKMAILEKEFKYYLQNQDSFVEKHLGKYIVIKDNDVIGVFETEIEAIEETSKKYQLGTFLVQKCEPGNANYTQTYHSRVAFV